MSAGRTGRVWVAGLLSLAFTAPHGALGANWPQWRGPLGNGVAPEGNPPVTWCESNNVGWKAEITGAGNASPIVWGDRVFVLTAVETDQKPPPKADPEEANLSEWQRRTRVKTDTVHRFDVLALRLTDGGVVWRRTAAELLPPTPRHRDASWASHSPVTDGDYLFAHFGSQGLHCYDLDGNPRWKRDFGVMRTRNHFGEGSSPAVCGDRVIVVWDHEGGSFVTALDRKTGETKWRVNRDEVTAWATPTVVTVNGKPQVLTSATGKIRSYDPQTGAVVWETSGMVTNVIATPAVQDGVGFFASGYRTMASLMAIDLARASEARQHAGGSAAILWQHQRDTPYVPSPLVYSNCVYIFRLNEPFLTCLDARSGAVRYGPTKMEPMNGVYSSPVAVADRIYATGRNGVTVVLRAGPVLDILAANTLDDSFTASPAIAGDRLLLRGARRLYCVRR
jgi:outer membrane protein assembly factor BamB